MTTGNDSDEIEHLDRSQLGQPWPLLANTQDEFAPKDQKLGTALILCSCAFFSGTNTSVRYASETLGFHPIFIAVFRGVSQFILVVTVIMLFGFRRTMQHLPPKAGVLLIIRGFLGSVMIFSKYQSLSRLPVGIAVSFFSIAPIFAALFGWIFVREALTASDVISMTLSLSGAVLVGRSDGPFKFDGQFVGIAFAVFAAVSRALVFIFVRLLCTRVHFLLSVQASSIGAMVTPFLFRVMQVGNVSEAWKLVGENFLKTLSTRETLLAMSCIGVFSFAASLCLNRALQLLDAGNAATLRTFDIPINFLTGFLVLGEVPRTAGQIFGCLLITVGIYLNAAAKRKS